MKKTMEDVREALIKVSFKSNAGKGVRVCYPNEVLAELYGKDVLDNNYIKEDIESTIQTIKVAKEIIKEALEN